MYPQALLSQHHFSTVCIIVISSSSVSYLIDFRMAVKLSVELRMVLSCCIHGGFSRIAGKSYISNANCINGFRALENCIY